MRKNEPRTGGRSLFPVFQQIKNYRLMWSGDFATHSSVHLCILVCCFFVIFLLSPPSSFASSPNLTADERQYLLDYFKEFPNCTSKIDAVRVFVYNSSLHAEPMDKDGWKTILMLKKMISFNKKETNDRPHLTCGPRAKCMQYILSFLNIKSYLVQIYSDNRSSFLSHTFLNAYNQDTSRFEVQDPDYNLFYVDKKSKKRLQVQDLIFSDLSLVDPVFDNGKKIVTGWNNSNIILREQYFEAVMLWNAFVNGSSLLIINQGRFNPFVKKSDTNALIKGQDVNFLEWTDIIYRQNWKKPFFILLQ